MGKERKRDLTEYEKSLIENYFNDQLTPKEQQEFENLMKEDEVFADWADKYRQAALWIDSIADEELLKGLEMDIEQLDVTDEDLNKYFGDSPLLLDSLKQLLGKNKPEDATTDNSPQENETDQNQTDKDQTDQNTPPKD